MEIKMATNLKEYITEKEETDFGILNEDFGMTAAIVLGIATVPLLAAYGGALIVAAYTKAIKGTSNAVLSLMKQSKENIKSIGKEDADIVIQKLAGDAPVQKAKKQTEIQKREYEDELGDVYDKIKSGDIDGAAKLFKLKKSSYQYDPDIQRVIVLELTKFYGEIPMYVVSPGNKTYAAIKKFFNIRVARASAEAAQRAIINKSSGKEEETREEEE